MESKGTTRRWKPWHIVVVALLGTMVLGGGIVALAFSLTRPVVTASDSFMTALRSGDFQAAYAMGTPQLRSKLGGAPRLGEMFGAHRPSSWSWSSRQIRNGVGRVSGRVVYDGGGKSDVTIFLLPEQEDWRISGFRMNPQ